MECVVIQEPFSRLGIQGPQYTEILNKWQEIIVCIYSKHSDEDMYLNVLKTITRQYNTIEEMIDAYSTALIPLNQNVIASDFNVSYALNRIITILKEILHPPPPQPPRRKLDPFAPSRHPSPWRPPPPRQPKSPNGEVYREPFSRFGVKHHQLDWAKDRWRDMIFRIIDNHPNEDLYQEVLKVITTKYDTIKEMYEAWSNINSLMQNYPESDGNIRANLFNLTNMLKDIMNPRPRINRLDPFGPSH